VNIFRKSLLVLVLGAALVTLAGSATKSEPVSTSVALSSNELNQQWMVEGEKRYRTNCGRCHQAPHKFPPRAMAVAVRHMRVRAMLTEEDMKYVLYYTTH